MTAHKIAFTSLNGAETFPTDGFHWTPDGHKEIAARLMSILPQAGDLPAPGRHD
jgi:lysophospholipase L1-like esterase